MTWTTFIHGQVGGLIFYRTLTVLGLVQADVICDRLHVRGQGVLTGVVKYKQV